MKKIIYVFMAVSLLLGSCKKDDVNNTSRDGLIDFRLTTTLNGTPSVYTRASGDGGLTNVTDNVRYIMGIYDAEGETLIGSYYQIVETGTQSVSFDVRLLAKEYRFVFWADFVDADQIVQTEGSAAASDKYYSTADLKAVALTGSYSGNNEARDAYTAVKNIDLTGGSMSGNITLERPFGKIRVVTTDIPNIQGYSPNSITVTYTNGLPSAFNVVTQSTVAGQYTENGTTYGYILPEAGDWETISNDGKVLVWDYILPGKVSFTLKTTGGSDATSRVIEGIPVAKNKLTTIKGPVLTHGASLTVSVDDAFGTPDADITLTEVVTVAALQQALNSGATNIKLLNDLTDAAEITLPAVASPEISIDIPANSQNVQIKGSNGGTTAPAVNLNIVGAGTLTVETPNSTVSFAGTANEATVTTAENTFVVKKGADIGTLNVAKGNVVAAYGTIQQFGSVNSGSKIFWEAANETELRSILLEKGADNNDGVILTADIAGSRELTGAQENQDLFRIGEARQDYVTTEYDGYVFDGAGFTVSGSAWNNLFAVYANDAVIKNVTFKQTDGDKARRANAGISIYRSKRIVMENVNIENCGKAGVIINASTATATNLNTTGNAWGGVNVSLGGSPAGGEDPEFTLISGNIEENTQIYGGNFKVTLPSGWFVSGYDGTTKVWSNKTPATNWVKGDWIPDRTVPKSWNVTATEVSLTTAESPGGSDWYAWHGLLSSVTKLESPRWSVETTLTTPAGQTARQSVWLHVQDSNGTTIDWCVIGYKVDEIGTKSWQWYDSKWEEKNPADPESGWSDISVAESSSYAVKIDFDGKTITQSVNGKVVNSYDLAETSTKIAQIIFNSRSFGNSYLTTWTYPVVK